MILPVKSAGWVLNEKLTSLQITAIDLNATFALDKRAGQTDTLFSTITVGSSGSFEFSSSSSLIFDTGSTLTINGLLNGITDFASSLTFGTASTITFGTGCTLLMSGTAAEIQFTGTNSNLNFASTTFAEFKTGSFAQFDNNSYAIFKSGSTLELEPSSIFILFGDVQTYATSTITLVNPTSNIVLLGGGLIAKTGCAGISLESPQSIKFAATRTYTKLIKSAPAFDTGGYNIDTTAPNLPITTSTSSKFLVWNIDVPEGATITGYNVFMKGAPAHAGLPLNMPQVTLSGQNILTKTILFSDTVTDSSASTAAYQAAHTIGNTGLSFSVNNSGTGSCFRLAFLSESSTNALVGALIYGATITYTLAQMDDAR